MYLNGEFEKDNLEFNKKFFYSTFLSNPEENILVGALSDKKIVASASLQLNLSHKKTSHIGTWGIAIHPDFHNQGLGYKLIKIIEDIAKEKGLMRLEADYYDGNIAAEKLYIDKLNYTLEGRRKSAVLLKNGKYADKICIGKIIDNSLISH